MLPSNPRKKQKTDIGSVARTIEENTTRIDAPRQSSLLFPDVANRDGDNRRKRKLDKETAYDVTGPTTSLLDLNDDCLHEILGPKNLSVMDLVSISQTCTRLKGIGKAVFVRSFRTNESNFHSISVKRLSDTEARRVFQTFGSVMVKLNINLGPNFHSNPAGIMDAIIECCTSLESLSLGSYGIPDNQVHISELAKLFQKLKKLHMFMVGIENVDYLNGLITPNGNLMDCFTNCDSLIDLKVKECFHLEPALYSSTFPKLQHFAHSYSEFDDIDEPHTIGAFVLRHKNLKSLRLEHELTTDFIQVLKCVATCKYLEKLIFNFTRFPTDDDTSLKSLKRLPNLRELKISQIKGHVMKVVKELPRLASTLEILELDFAGGECNSKLILAVSKLKNLRVFRLNNVNEMKDIDLIGELKNVRELSLTNVKAITFNLIQIVSRLENLTKLTFFVESFAISKQMYFRLVVIVGGRLEAKNRFLDMECRTADNFDDLIQSKTVKVSDYFRGSLFR